MSPAVPIEQEPTGETAAQDRRPATRGVFAIEKTELLPPDPIALAPSFVAEALIATQPQPRDTKRGGDGRCEHQANQRLRIFLANLTAGGTRYCPGSVGARAGPVALSRFSPAR